MIAVAGDTFHASAVAYQGNALLIRGRSGCGKSALAMQLLGLGAELIADDRTILRRDGPRLLASAPAPIAGLIEVRGIGLLKLPHLDDIPVAACIDLDVVESERLPTERTTVLLGCHIVLLRRVEGPHVGTALLHCLAGARIQPDDEP